MDGIEKAGSCRKGRAAGRWSLIGMLILGCGAPPVIAAEEQLETLVLNRGRTFVGKIVDADRNTVAIRPANGMPAVVRTDDIQTVFIPPKAEGGPSFFGSFVGWEDGVYELNINFERVKIKDGVMQGQSVPLSPANPQPALVIVSEAEPATPAAVTTLNQPAASEAVDQAAGGPLETSPEDGGPVLRIEADQAQEDANALIYRLTLSAPLGKPFYMAYSTLDGTAEAGEDFEAVRDVLVIPAGQQQAELLIPLIDNDQAEPDETVSLSVGASNRSVTIDRSGLESLIVDNDR